MLYPAMNVLTNVIPNRYLLVNVVAHRAREIAEEAEESGERLREKPVTMAIHEVAEGRLDPEVVTDVRELMDRMENA